MYVSTPVEVAQPVDSEQLEDVYVGDSLLEDVYVGDCWLEDVYVGDSLLETVVHPYSEGVGLVEVHPPPQAFGTAEAMPKRAKAAKCLGECILLGEMQF